MGLVVALGVPVAASGIPLPTDGTRVTVALVQGDVPEPGLDFNAERRAVLDNHVRGTLAVAAHEPADLSLVIWPENSSDIDPIRNPDAAAQVQRALDAVGVPLLIGAVLDEPTPDVSNASLFYRPGAAAPERYVKLHPVPFAEYIPYKSFFRIFSDKVDLVRRPFVAGHTIGGFRVDSSEGTYWALPTICFEVAYDGLVRNAVTQPGRQPGLLVVQTNNATFGYSDESEQQFAISRIRAIEHGRSVAHVSTVGVSGFINPDGSVTRARRGSSRRPRSSGTRSSAPARPSRTGWARCRRSSPSSPCSSSSVPHSGSPDGLGSWHRRPVRATRTRGTARAPRRGARAPRAANPRARTPPLSDHPTPDEDLVLEREPLRRVAVLIPTYNERENLAGIVDRVRTAAPEVDVVVLDDASPDGTGDLADELAAADPRVHVIHRPGKHGLGAAYLHGFQWALDEGYDAVVEMDADGSHRPEHLPALLDAARDADLVIGSRWVRGGAVVNWPLHRKALSVGGNIYTRVLLGMGVHDATAGYRVYRTSALRRMGLSDVASQGYCFQVDLTWRASRRGLTVVEVPITFIEREVGDSKMSRAIMTESLRRITSWGVGYRGGQLRSAAQRLSRSEPRWHRL